MAKAKKRRRLPFFSISFRLILTICAVTLVLSYLSIFANPQHFSILSFFGLYYIPIAFINIALLIVALIRRSRSGWIPFLTLLPSLFFAEFYFQFGNKEELTTNKDITILTYNVGRFRSSSSNPNETLQEISSFVKEVSPDVIAFQEYRTSDTNSIKNSFPNYPYSQKRFFHFKKGNYFVGNVILSKYPIKAKGKIPFEQTTNLATYSDIEIEGELTRIYNLHLESNSISLTSLIKKIKGTYEEFSNEVAHVHEKVKNSNTKRGEQVRDVIEHIENCPYKSIICGDFNDTPMSYSFRKLYQGRKDTFKEAGSGFAATYTTFWPLLRIDYILTPESYNILNHQTRRVKFSDHYPVLAKFSIQ